MGLSVFSHHCFVDRVAADPEKELLKHFLCLFQTMMSSILYHS